MSPPKFFIYLCSVFQFGFALASTLTWSHRPYEVSVRNLAGLGVNVADDDSLSAYRTHSRASSPRFVAEIAVAFASY